MSDDQMMGEPSLATESNRISHVIGIMSGKGGVGKSLVTGLLAGAFRRAGCSVGILDADITGPSIPMMFGIKNRPHASELGIFPVETETGIKVMSINMLLERPDDAVIWRGPMISNTVEQFWKDVFWGELDYLFIDLPPGTADVPLTVMQSLPLEWVIVVTSPQDLAAMVVRKAINMCRKLEKPILGLVQNMALLRCPRCEDVIYPFGATNGELLAHEMGLPHIVDIPIDPEISARADAGTIEYYEDNPFMAEFESISNAIEASALAKGATICDAHNPCG